MQETQEIQVQSLGWEDPLEEDMETHSSILAWRICMDRGAWWATVHGVTKSQTQLKWLSMPTKTLQHTPNLNNQWDEVFEDIHCKRKRVA